jgi:hypothetical protein
MKYLLYLVLALTLITLPDHLISQQQEEFPLPVDAPPRGEGKIKVKKSQKKIIYRVPGGTKDPKFFDITVIKGEVTINIDGQEKYTIQKEDTVKVGARKFIAVHGKEAENIVKWKAQKSSISERDTLIRFSTLINEKEIKPIIISFAKKSPPLAKVEPVFVTLTILQGRAQFFIDIPKIDISTAAVEERTREDVFTLSEGQSVKIRVNGYLYAIGKQNGTIIDVISQ